jgi:hypothetical protein
MTRRVSFTESQSGTLPDITSIDPDDVYPTAEETATLPRMPDRVPFASYLVAIVELGERFSYYGTTGTSPLGFLND